MRPVGAGGKSAPVPPSYTHGMVDRYKRCYRTRIRLLTKWKDDPGTYDVCRELYRRDPVTFINTWLTTYDPRNAPRGLPALLPFILFERQTEMVAFITQCLAHEADGVIDKSREVGATWVACAWSVWAWLFMDNISIGWGSLLERNVDAGANPSSIFEKMRILIRNLPPQLLPADYATRYMHIVNHDRSNLIQGEGGDNIGRGGRNLIYFVDEAAHLARPERIEAALSANTRTRVLMSTVKAGAVVFDAKVETGIPWQDNQPMANDRANVFVFDWSDNPMMTQDEYDAKRAKYAREGMLHVFRQEYDRDASGSLVDQIIAKGWIEAATDAHLAIPALSQGAYMGSLDVADEGGDFSALSIRKGLTLKHLERWDEDTQRTTRRAIRIVTPYLPKEGRLRVANFQLQYDSVGVGAGVKGEANRLAEEGLLPDNIEFVPWNAGSAVILPDENVIPGDRDSPTNADHYANLKAQAVWSLRNRFEKTYQVRVNDEDFPADELISISSDIPQEVRRQLVKELCGLRRRPTSNLKEGIDKMGSGRSPDLGDSVVQLYFPCDVLSAYARSMLNPSTFQ